MREGHGDRADGLPDRRRARLSRRSRTAASSPRSPPCALPAADRRAARPARARAPARRQLRGATSSTPRPTRATAAGRCSTRAAAACWASSTWCWSRAAARARSSSPDRHHLRDPGASCARPAWTTLRIGAERGRSRLRRW
ncbi:MAG: hypothetical protein MZW92_27005 [Comamonadaceae bacterium]|nr:hypothetical protein [Comamonadaceae bacterium]